MILSYWHGWHFLLWIINKINWFHIFPLTGITATIESTKSSTCKGKLSPDIKDSKMPPFPSRHRTVSHGADILPPLPDVVKDLPPCHLPRGGRRPSVPPPREIEHHPEWFNERLLLFESLCKHSGAKPTTQVTPSNLLVVPSNLSAKQRATSCHNLSQNPPVKDICKYFEGKNTGYLAPPVLNVEDVGIVVPARSHEVAKRRFSHMDHTFTPLVRLTKHISWNIFCTVLFIYLLKPYSYYFFYYFILIRTTDSYMNRHENKFQFPSKKL